MKGQVTGPISFGLTVTDQTLRASLYNEQLADLIEKNAIMNARWQIRRLQRLRPNVVMMVDEPYMSSFGSAYISLEKEQVINTMELVFDAIHAEGAIAGVHCCGNTDWSLLLETSVDIISLDAFDHLDMINLYPLALSNFLAREGAFAWGIVPNGPAVLEHDGTSLGNRLRDGLRAIRDKAEKNSIDLPPFDDMRNIITPSCGLGPVELPLADQVLEIVVETAEIMRSSSTLS